MIGAWGAWLQVTVYAALTFVNSGACIGWLQHWLWLPLQQYSYDALNTAAHSHVMNLSSDFHESKDASDIHQAVFQGRSITSLVDTICFSVLPMFLDLFLIGGYLFLLFGPYMTLDLLVTTLFYIYTTTKLVAMAQGRRRIYITHNIKEWTSAYSSIGNWRVSTVGFFFLF
jgi:ABC-type transport system involved in Fe-S cluster assembly fused permease/ATPase subunit